MNDTSLLAQRLLEKGEKIELTFQFATDDDLLQIYSIASKVLSRIDRVFFLESLITMLRELIHNAFKANAKRVFFRKMGVPIDDPDSYAAGMADFSVRLKKGFEGFKEDLEHSDLYVGVTMEKATDGIIIQIVNNSAMTGDELNKIHARIRDAKKNVSFMEVYNQVYDTSEGAGLGIILVLMLMRHSGIDMENFSMFSDRGITRAVITVPFNFRPLEITTRVKEEILVTAGCLPVLPESVNELLPMCADESVTVDQMTKKILHDPSLAADLLKTANSAGFVSNRRIESIHDALMVIGFENFESLLLVAGAKRILSQRYKKFEELWDHCYKTAFYARALAKKLGRQDLSEKVALAGLLHDLGKIVLLSVSLDLVHQIADLVANRKIRTTTLIEEATIGLSHASIGGMIASAWNFPEYLVEAISLHHTPLSAAEENRDVVYITYLANMMLGVESGAVHYWFLETQVLERYNLVSGGSFKAIHDSVLETYTRHFNI